METLENNYKSLEKNYNDTQLENDNLKSTLREGQNSNNLTTKISKDLSEHNKKLKSEIDDLEKTNEDLEKEFKGYKEDTEKRIVALNFNSRLKDNDMTKLRAESANMRVDNETLKGELEEVKILLEKYKKDYEVGKKMFLTGKFPAQNNQDLQIQTYDNDNGKIIVEPDKSILQSTKKQFADSNQLAKSYLNDDINNGNGSAIIINPFTVLKDKINSFTEGFNKQPQPLHIKSEEDVTGQFVNRIRNDYDHDVNSMNDNEIQTWIEALKVSTGKTNVTTAHYKSLLNRLYEEVEMWYPSEKRLKSAREQLINSKDIVQTLNQNYNDNEIIAFAKSLGLKNLRGKDISKVKEGIINEYNRYNKKEK